uniref:Uncharacterized protein n=1 Tax=Anopheles christyi TaxID=43041 RepID=A0A182KCT9_9DIPT
MIINYAFKRPELLKTKMGTSGFVVSTSTKVLTGGASAASGASQTRPRPAILLGSGEAKANDQLNLFDRFAGHAGVAEPMTDEEYQSELHRATERASLRTTTPREGLSTWVLLSGSESTEMKSESTSTTRKAAIVTTTSTTPKPTTATKRFQPSTRRVMQTTTPRPARTMTTVSNSPSTPVQSEEKKDKPNKPLPKQKIVSTTLKPVIVKKVKKPPTTTTTTTTTTTPKPTTTSTTTTEMVITEQSASTAASDLPVAVTDDSSVESSTFLILEPKDAQFDLPEDRSPAKTAPAGNGGKVVKKPTRKPNAKAPGKKKPANKKTRKPEVKDVVANDKKPGNKNKPVSTQIINYLSREVMPTVGVGLVGLVMAAGLASYFLGSPLGALRRSDDRKDDLYYSNYEEYAGPDGQNEEDVFGKLIAGMPDRSYYRNNAVRRRTQVQPVRTGHQYYHVQPYSANKYPHITYRNRAYGGASGAPTASEAMYTNVNRPAQAQAVSQAKAQNEFFYNTPPTPYYPVRTVSVETPTRQPAAPVYSSSSLPPTTSTTVSPSTVETSNTAANPIVEPEHEMMPNPEAYSSEHSPEHHAQYVVGTSYSDSMLDMINSAPVPEHGPRRKRRSVGSSDDEDVEFENEIDVDEDRPKDQSEQSTHSGEVTELNLSETTMIPSLMESTTTEAHRYTWGDFIRNTVERKVAMGIHFLQHVTTDFQRYLNGVQDRFTVHSQHHNHTSSSSEVTGRH